MDTQLDNILVKNKHCNYELLYKRKPKVWRELHGFGEICICSNLSTMSSKIKNKGELAMMVGFSYNHPSLTYRLFKFKTKSIIHSRDIVWLNKYYSEYFKSNVLYRNLMSQSIPLNEYSESEYNGFEGTSLIIPMDRFNNDEFQEELDNDGIDDNDISIPPVNKKTIKELKLLDYSDKPII